MATIKVNEKISNKVKTLLAVCKCLTQVVPTQIKKINNEKVESIQDDIDSQLSVCFLTLKKIGKEYKASTRLSTVLLLRNRIVNVEKCIRMLGALSIVCDSNKSLFGVDCVYKQVTRLFLPFGHPDNTYSEWRDLDTPEKILEKLRSFLAQDETQSSVEDTDTEPPQKRSREV